MKKVKNNVSNFNKILIILIFLIVVFKIFSFLDNGTYNNLFNNSKNTLNILSSYENSSMENEITNYAYKMGKTVNFIYKGDLEIVDELNNNSTKYDAVWISNSMWLYLLDNSYLTSDSKSISISPVVFGIKKSKAKELNLIDSEVTNNTILDLIKNKKIKYVMSSVTQTNTGATAYLGFLSSLAGNPEVLTEEMINDEKLEDDLMNLFSGVERVSGDDDYLRDMFLNSNDYEAVIAAESSIIEINKKLVADKKEPLYLIYPSDGVAINDSTFAFINNDSSKEELFLDIQSYLLSDEGKKELTKSGLRTWYGGVNDKSDKKVFNSDWGIDTTKYLNVTKFPSKKVISAALNLYVEKLRKPTHVVFCLDISGSMYGTGLNTLKDAMDYILDYEKAKEEKIQFSEKDKIIVIPFGSSNKGTYESDGRSTSYLISTIRNFNPTGGTNIYGCAQSAIEILNKYDKNEYTKTVVLMTDGESNVGSIYDFRRFYGNNGNGIPVYSIMFGSARKGEL